MEPLNQILQSFSPISLGEMDSVKLMNRTDTKFLLTLDQLKSILKEVQPDYRVLTIEDRALNSYETLYYDTHDFLFYRRHHSGKKNRYKIRKRKYVESNLTFLEVKFKTNKDRTIKDRTKLQTIEENLEQVELDFIENETHLDLSFEPKLWNSFQRITFVSLEIPERITIDLDLKFKNDQREIVWDSVVIAEVKQERQNRHSPFMIALKKRLIRQESVSKYSLGAAMLYPGLKSNSFKSKILKLRKLNNGMVA
jgi:hypothetical protein